MLDSKAHNPLGTIAGIVVAGVVVAGCGGSGGGAAAPTVSNQPPNAVAGPDQTVTEADAVTLDGTGSSDVDGSIASYQWVQTGGTPTVTLSDATSATANVTAPAVTATETLSFTLTVTDNQSATHADTVDITVNPAPPPPPANQPPTADAGPDQTVNEANAVMLNGTGSTDPDGTTMSFAWAQIGGTSVNLNGAATSTPSFAAPALLATEVLSFELTVTDDRAATSTDTVDITVNGVTILISDDFDDGNANGWVSFDDGAVETPSSWSAVTGAYRQSVEALGRDRIMLVGASHVGTYSLLSASTGLSDYSFRVSVVPESPLGNDIGVMFRYTDANNYYRLSLNSQRGFARLERIAAGNFTTLAHNHRGYRPNEIQNFTIEVEGPLILVFVNGDALFGAFDATHSTGGVAVYTLGAASFDNVTVAANTLGPQVVTASPVAHSVLPGGAQNVQVEAIVRNQPVGTGTVSIEVDNVDCGIATENPLGVYSVQCANVQPGDHAIEAFVRDSGLPVHSDLNTSVAVGSAALNSRLYDAIGDSITLGVADEYATDNLNLIDQRTLGFFGWTGLAGDDLTERSGGANPSLIRNEAISGETTVNTSQLRLPAILERETNADAAIVMIGTNDSRIAAPLPSGAGCAGISCDNTYKGYMLDIIAQLQAAGRSTIHLPTLPPAWGNTPTSSAPYADPLALTATRNQTIIEFNNVIINELAGIPGVVVGPDVFSCLLTPSVNRYSLFADNLHPNGLGYRFFKTLIANALTNGPDPIPTDPCAAPIYILENVTPYGYQQNLLDTNSPYYADEAFTFTAIPTELQAGIWVTPRNSDRTISSNGLVSFDVGPGTATVYLAHDPAGVPPSVDTGQVFSAYTPSTPLTGTDPAVPSFALVSATNVTGVVTLGGTLSGGAGAQASYLAIVVPD